MSLNLRRLLGALLLAGSLTCLGLAQTESPAAEKQQTGETPSAAAEPQPQTPPPAPDAPAAAPETSPAPESPQAVTEPDPEAGSTDAPVPQPGAEATPDPKSETRELRRLDVEEGDSQPATAQSPARSADRKHQGGRRGGGAPRVMIGGDAFLGKGESADAVVAIGGNATAEGEVHDAVVAIGGDARATGSVGEGVVAVFGNVYVDTEARDVVSVLGSIELGPNARIHGDVVAVGGKVQRDPQSVVHGDIPQIGLPTFGFNAEPLQAYIRECVFKARPLAFAPHLGWAWAIAFGFLAFYCVLALLFGGAVEKCVTTLTTRPGRSVLAAVLTFLLTPVLFVLLLITVAGTPVLMVTLLVATLFGKVVMLAWIGSRVTRLVGQGALLPPVVSVLVGGLIVLLLYVVPVVGFIVYKALGFIGLGVVVYTVILSGKREKRPATPTPVAGPSAPSAAFTDSPAASTAVPPAAASDAGTTPLTSAGFAAAATAEPPPATYAQPATPPLPPPVAVAALERAGFWIRLGALAIDFVLVAVVVGFSHAILPRFLHIEPPGMLLILAVYGAVLWKLRGTTIGGIICGLRVVRVDGREIDWATALVRALGCFLSFIVVFLGFIWVAIDDEKQSWHDKIAGTTVVYSRGSPSLV